MNDRANGGANEGHVATPQATTSQPLPRAFNHAPSLKVEGSRTSGHYSIARVMKDGNKEGGVALVRPDLPISENHVSGEAIQLPRLASSSPNR